MGAGKESSGQQALTGSIVTWFTLGRFFTCQSLLSGGEAEDPRATVEEAVLCAP